MAAHMIGANQSEPLDADVEKEVAFILDQAAKGPPKNLAIISES